MKYELLHYSESSHLTITDNDFKVVIDIDHEDFDDINEIEELVLKIINFDDDGDIVDQVVNSSSKLLNFDLDTDGTCYIYSDKITVKLINCDQMKELFREILYNFFVNVVGNNYPKPKNINVYF